MRFNNLTRGITTCNATVNLYWREQVNTLCDNSIENISWFKCISWEQFYHQYRQAFFDRNFNLSSFKCGVPVDIDAIQKFDIYKSDSHLVFELLLELKANDSHLFADEIILLQTESYDSRCAYQYESPLLLAARYGSIKIFKYLLSIPNICVNIKRKDNDQTPLIVAAFWGHFEIVKMIIDHCKLANVLTDLKDVINSQASYGVTPIFVASQNGFDKIVVLLLQNGADINIKDTSGYTPLQIACKHGHVNIVRLLTESEASIRTIDVNQVPEPNV